MKKFCFVILHYNEKSLSDTFECVESIEISCQKWRDQYQMIIVENGSGDSSASVLTEKYHNQKNIDVVISQENLGFAKGNNLGCDFAVNNYNPEFLIVINNDTVLKQEQFLELIEKKYKQYEFDVLGPYIYDRNLRPQNPALNLLTTLEEVNNLIYKLQNPTIQKNGIYRLKAQIKKIKFIDNFIYKFRSKEKITASSKDIQNIGLFGAALIFSGKYFRKYNDVFYSKTFMYAEEDILFHRIRTDNLISIYSPELEIYHKEDKSTEAKIGEENTRNDWKTKQSIESLTVLRDLIISVQKNK